MTVARTKKRRTTKKAKAASRTGGRGHLRVVVGAVCLLVAAGLVYVWSANRVIGVGYEISSLEEDLRRADDLNRKLRVELTSLKRPDLVERIARQKLGLVRPSPDRIVVLK